MKHSRPVGMGVRLGAVSAVLLTVGCALIPPNSFLDPTAVGRYPLEVSETGIRRVLTPRDKGTGLENAVEPTPEDLVAPQEEHRIGPGDILSITIDELVNAGQPYNVQLIVSNTGYIDLPKLGLINCVGLSEMDLRRELVNRLRDAGLLVDPVVQVVLTVRQAQRFTILGNTTVAGTYELSQPDLRLLEAIGFARDIGPTVRKLYVIRQVSGKKDTPSGSRPGDRPAREGLIIPPPSEDDEEVRGSFFAARGWPSEQETQPSQQPSRQEMEALLAPEGQQTQPSGGQKLPAVIFDPSTGQPSDVTPPRSTTPQPSGPAPVAPEPPSDFSWDDLPEYELVQRTIEIDVQALKAGDPRYNIVIRNRDQIVVPVDTGVFYLMGQINRPGVFGLNDREVTLKQALGAIGGGFAPLAWPARCEIIRREKGTDKQITMTVDVDRIFAGLEPDIVLQDDDLVNVGTHTLAPFLFVIRNSFRFTYGFGFVYDRNFADKDAYSAKLNPEIVEQNRRAQRGLPF